MGKLVLEVENIGAAIRLMQSSRNIHQVAFQNIDFTGILDITTHREFSNCIFLGCTIPLQMHEILNSSNLIFPKMDVPFEVYPHGLYNLHTLYEGYDPHKPHSYAQCRDQKIYTHYLKKGKKSFDIKETLARRLHDHSIENAISDFILTYPVTHRIAIMGGHSLSRSDDNYIKVCKIAKRLTERGLVVMTGGGPGAMEAGHLGAWMAGRPDTELDHAIDILSKHPKYTDDNWLATAFDIIVKFPNPIYHSLGIPTWLYGHEPSSPFATQIAKFFANSVREDGLLALATGGVIFAPGSAGTIQEIFQDAAQNHYLTEGISSPMVFLNKEYWQMQRPIYPLIKKLANEGKYKNLQLHIHDEIKEIVDLLG